MKAFLSIFLSWILFSQLAVARTNTCSSIFIQDRMEKINEEAKIFIQKQFSPEQQQNFLKNYLLNRALEKVSLEKLSQQKDLELALQILYRRLIKLGVKNENQLPANEWVEQTLFIEGLRPFLKDYQSLTSEPHFNARLVQFFSHRAIQFLIIPGQLPHMKDAPLPAELLAKIYLTGVRDNQAAIHEAYIVSGQSRSDFYRKIQDAYQKVFLAVTVVFLIQSYQESQQDLEDLKKGTYKNSFDELEQSLLELDHLLEQKGFYKNP